MDPACPEIIYIVNVIRALVPLITTNRWEAYTERHLDLKLFGPILEPLGYWIYREIQSIVSKLVRGLSASNTSVKGHLVDYLKLV